MPRPPANESRARFQITDFLLWTQQMGNVLDTKKKNWELAVIFLCYKLKPTTKKS